MKTKVISSEELTKGCWLPKRFFAGCDSCKQLSKCDHKASLPASLKAEYRVLAECKDRIKNIKQRIQNARHGADNG